MGHVVGAVPDVGQGQPGQPASLLPDGHQVGQHLTGMELIGQRVDHRHARVRGHLRDPGLLEGPPDDRRALPAEHPRGVGDRLPLADPGQPAIDDHREPAQLGHSGAERGLGAQRRLVEQQGDAARASQRADLNGSALSASARSSTAACSAGVRSSSARKWRRVMSRLRPSRPGRAATKESSCDSVMIRGGASRSTSGRGALTMKPASSAASATAGATGAVSVTARSRPRPRTPVISRVAERQDRRRQLVPEVVGPRQQSVPLDHRDHGQAGDGRDRVAAEGAAVAARPEQGRRPAGRDAGADREAVAQALGHRHDVGGDALGHMHQPAAGAAHPGLHLVHPEQCAVRVADLPGLRPGSPAAAPPPRSRPGWAPAPPRRRCSSTAAASASASP